MRSSRVVFLILLVLVVFLGLNSLFILNETEQAIITKFGKPVGGTYSDAGIHYKIPFIHKIHIFEKRLLEWDGSPQEVPTQDNKFIHIDTYARWRISDPLSFKKKVQTESSAHSRLDDLLDGAVRDEVATQTLPEIIRSTDRKMVVRLFGGTEETEQNTSEYNIKGARIEIEEHVLANVAQKLKDLELGIEVVDFRFKRIDYNKGVEEKVFGRMIAEQNKIAEKYRAIGQGEKQKIMGQTSQKKKEILSEAYRKAQEIKGNADAEAIDIYATAYNQSAESVDFYVFMRSLSSYHTALDSSTTLLISTGNDYLKYLKSAK